MTHIRAISAVTILLFSATVLAQSAAPPNAGPGTAPGGMAMIQATVQSLSDAVLTVRTEAGATQQFTLPEGPRIEVSVPRTLADIKPGDFVGSAAVIGEDGRRYAEEVHYIPETMRAQVEGHRQMGTDTNRSMTNATVSQVVRNSGAQGGDELTLKYSGGEKTIVVRPGTPVVATQPADISMLKPGVKINVMTVKDAAGATSISGVRIIQ